jgi:hypothetical protein
MLRLFQQGTTTNIVDESMTPMDNHGLLHLRASGVFSCDHTKFE